MAGNSGCQRSERVAESGSVEKVGLLKIPASWEVQHKLYLGAQNLIDLLARANKKLSSISNMIIFLIVKFIILKSSNIEISYAIGGRADGLSLKITLTGIILG
jgi:hypothetical protein